MGEPTKLPDTCECGGRLVYDYGPGDYISVCCLRCTPVVEVRIESSGRAPATREEPGGMGEPTLARERIEELAEGWESLSCDHQLTEAASDDPVNAEYLRNVMDTAKALRVLLEFSATLRSGLDAPATRDEPGGLTEIADA